MLTDGYPAKKDIKRGERPFESAGNPADPKGLRCIPVPVPKTDERPVYLN
jgi:hypothetical protein